MNSNLKIYSVPNYKITPEATKCTEATIQSIITDLKSDKQFHERIQADSLIKLNIDLDGYSIKTFRTQFKEYLYNELGLSVSLKDFKYTTNTAKVNSHHVVIPGFYGKSITLKAIFKDFRLKYANDSKSIDVSHLGVGESGQWFRLPNQTKEGKKGTEHIIKEGKLSQFVLKYIPINECQYMDDLESVQKLISKNEKPMKKKKPIKVQGTNEEQEVEEEEQPIDLDLSIEYNQYLNLLSVKRISDYNE